MNINYQIQWQISDQQGDTVIDPLLFELLDLIKQLGSLQQASKSANVSYRHAWGLFNKWQPRLGQLLILEKGRGAKLTSIGDKLLHTVHQLNGKFSPELSNIATEVKRDITLLNAQQNRPNLKIYASHGLAVNAFRQLLNEQQDIELDLHFHGSIESLQALEKGDCDIAGFHIPIGKLAKPLRQHYLATLQPGKHELIYVVKRHQGLMFRPEHQSLIKDINAVTNPELRFINRQTQSGTRLLFDQLIEAEHISPAQINGYDHEEFTHLAVAALIASNVADISFGIAPIAKQFNLGFLPLVWEHYCLAIPTDQAEKKTIKSLLRSDEFKQKLVDTEGYETEYSGKTVSFDTIFGPS